MGARRAARAIRAVRGRGGGDASRREDAGGDDRRAYLEKLGPTYELARAGGKFVFTNRANWIGSSQP